jgi:hypothetical protein
VLCLQRVRQCNLILPQVIYLITPTEESIRYVLDDFKSGAEARYGDVHIFFLTQVRMFTTLVAEDLRSRLREMNGQVPGPVMDMIRRSSVLCSRIKTFKVLRVHLD